VIGANHRTKARDRWSVLLAILILHLGPAASAGERGAGPISLRLDRVDGISSVPQGVAFPFRVTARNTGPTGQAIVVTIELMSPSTGSWDIREWSTMVPEGGSVSKEMAEVASQWFAETGTFTLIAKLNGIPNGNVLPSTVTPPPTVVPTFEDVTASSGLETQLPGDRGTSRSEGAAWGDVDGDGYPDLFVPIRNQQAQLWIYEPGSGTYSDRADSWNVTNPGGMGVSATFIDFDNDGDQDLYVVNDAIDPETAEPTGQGNRLYRNERAQGLDEFTDVSVAAGVGTQGNGSSASWGDYDGDGFLDLYVVTGNTHEPEITYHHPDHLFHNEGNGAFTDVTCESLPTNDPASGFCPADPHLGGSTGSGFQAVWVDFDRDGDVDLYLAQDWYESLVHKDINRLYRNDGFDPSTGNWTFTDLCAPPEVPGAECRQMSSMGIGVGDYDQDLWPDMAISNIGGSGGNVLLRNDYVGGFTEMGALAGVARPIQHASNNAVTWGLGFFDLNLDGLEDLYVVAGSLGPDRDQPDQVFVNTPDGTFLDLSGPSGAAEPEIGRGAAFADHDRDGMMDAYVLNVDGTPVLFRNTTPAAGHWVEVELTGTVSNRDACGARVVLTSGGFRQARWVVCGSSLGAGNDRVLHFGGLSGRKFSMDITWPSGLHELVRATGTDRLVRVTEGTAR
jgi:enediyne biosynthesis protein E4